MKRLRGIVARNNFINPQHLPRLSGNDAYEHPNAIDFPSAIPLNYVTHCSENYLFFKVVLASTSTRFDRDGVVGIILGQKISSVLNSVLADELQTVMRARYVHCNAAARSYEKDGDTYFVKDDILLDIEWPPHIV